MSGNLQTFPGMLLAERDEYVFSAPSMWRPFWKLIANHDGRTIHNLWVNDILVCRTPRQLLISFSKNEFIELSVEITSSKNQNYDPKLYIYIMGEGTEVKLMLYGKMVLDAIRHHSNAVVNPSIQYAKNFKNVREKLSFLETRFNDWNRTAPKETLTDILRAKYEPEHRDEVERLQGILVGYICELSKKLGARYISVSPDFFVCMENVQFVKHHKNPVLMKLEPLAHHICEALDIEGMRLDTGMITYRLPVGVGGVFDLTGDEPVRLDNPFVHTAAYMTAVAERRDRGESTEDWLARCAKGEVQI